MIDFNSLVPYIIKIDLTINEFMILTMKHLRQKRIAKAYKEKFIPKNRGFLTGTEKEKLLRLGYIIKDVTNNRETFFITEKFKDLFIDKFHYPNEVWKLYPAFIKINGKNAPLKNADKATWRLTYWHTIGGIKSEHKEILLDIQYGKENNLINVKITDFITSNAWEGIREIRLADSNVRIENEDINEF